MKNEFLADIKRIKEASNRNNLVIFVGAGISKNSNVPDWKYLIDTFLDELPEDLDDREFLKVAQLYKLSRSNKEYIDKVRSELKHNKVIYNAIHKAIFELNPIHIITTNYDNLLEQAALANNKHYYCIRKDKDIPYASYERLLVKMHGDMDDGNIVLTEDDYLNYEKNFPLTETFVRSLFASKLILFLGFSFNDYNLKIIVNKVQSLLGEDFQPMYLINPGKTDSLQRSYFKKKGLNVVDYNEIIDDEVSKRLTHLEQEDLNSLQHGIGKNLYKFMLFIFKYDSFEFENRNEFIIDIISKAIDNYLSELNVLGWKSISKIYPFNKGDEYSNFTLVTKIKELKDLHNHLRLSFDNKKKFLKDYGPKYKKIMKAALENGIYNIEFKN